MTVRPLKKGWEKRQCQFEVTRPPAHQCAKVAKKGSDFCQHHEKAGYAARSISTIDWDGKKAKKKQPPVPKISSRLIEEFGGFPIEAIQCRCGYPKCSYYQLNVGSFYQGTGFTKAQAELICELLNKGRRLDG